MKPGWDVGQQRRASDVIVVIASLVVAMSPASLATAEVMDKETTVAAIWTTTALLAAIGVLAWQHRYGLPLAVAAVLFGWLYYYGVLTELNDPSVGPAIIREAGPEYPNHLYAASAIVAAANVGGLIWRARRRALKRSQ